VGASHEASLTRENCEHDSLRSRQLSEVGTLLLLWSAVAAGLRNRSQELVAVPERFIGRLIDGA